MRRTGLQMGLSVLWRGICYSVIEDTTQKAVDSKTTKAFSNYNLVKISSLNLVNFALARFGTTE
jgi:hypothetical protein